MDDIQDPQMKKPLKNFHADDVEVGNIIVHRFLFSKNNIASQWNLYVGLIVRKTESDIYIQWSKSGAHTFLGAHNNSGQFLDNDRTTWELYK